MDGNDTKLGTSTKIGNDTKLGTSTKIGKDEKLGTNEKAVARPPLRPTTYISREEKRLLEEFRTLTPDEKRRVLAIARKLAERD